jgi:fatty-acyl-CoA synthase
MRGSEDATRESLTAQAAAGVGTWFAAPPLMHAAAQWTAFSALHCGGTLVLHDDSSPFDARTILETVARERVNLMSIVGDTFARRLLEELRARPYDLSSLHTLATGGAATSESAKQALFELLPHTTIVDGYGASETGGMAYGATRRGGRPGGFAGAAGAALLSADRRRFLARRVTRRSAGRPGAGASRSAISETAARPTRPSPSSRLAVPGDRARLGAHGASVLLGRDSLVVDTGGEKVFVEEVEDLLRRHPDVVDALVVGRPSERFGEEVVGIVQLRPGAALAPSELREFAARSIARFKAPRAFAFCERVRRDASGKGDYPWARSLAGQAVAAAAGTTS